MHLHDNSNTEILQNNNYFNVVDNFILRLMKYADATHFV